ncbi:hypothetical protein ILYODFUR_036547 [Ilyodon furcidens]|uniref:Uncharacterized protein n=1 Tax=Ilyodon furcidens TaxID=33524 RepID=A0ABV0UMG4_9TELE
MLWGSFSSSIVQREVHGIVNFLQKKIYTLLEIQEKIKTGAVTKPHSVWAHCGNQEQEKQRPNQNLFIDILSALGTSLRH